MFLAERFQLLLEAADDVGLIVVDSRFREDDARLRRFFADLTKDGSPYSRLGRIVEGLFLGPSHYSIGLQCADLVCAITAAAERGNGQARGYLRTAPPPLRDASGDRRARRRRDQALPRAGAAAARGDAALPAVGVRRAPRAPTAPAPRSGPRARSGARRSSDIAAWFSLETSAVTSVIPAARASASSSAVSAEPIPSRWCSSATSNAISALDPSRTRRAIATGRSSPLR